MTHQRVVVTGMGVVAPNGVGINKFSCSIREGKSGIGYIHELVELGLSCHIGGIPQLTEDDEKLYLPGYLANRIDSSSLKYGVLAGLEAWKNAGLEISKEVDWDSGVIMGAQSSDGTIAKNIVLNLFEKKDIRRISGRWAEQAMTSCTSAYLSGFLGLGNCCITNSSACSTGTEAIYMAFNKIRNKEAIKLLAGSSEGNSPFIWSVLDRIRALNGSSNDHPEEGSKPMSKDASGMVPGCGAGALVLENLESAQNRGAKIYAEIIAGSVNCGAQRNGGTMTKPNPEAVKHCIKKTLNEAQINSNEIDLISGHLTATYADPFEISCWSEALGLNKENFPFINSLKSMTGHCLAAAGSIESVAAVIQLNEGFIHPSLNSHTLHPEIIPYVNLDRVPQTLVTKSLSYIIKANFGFGDSNACLIFKKY